MQENDYLQTETEFLDPPDALLTETEQISVAEDLPTHGQFFSIDSRPAK